jgi:hypothetical protein
MIPHTAALWSMLLSFMFSFLNPGSKGGRLEGGPSCNQLAALLLEWHASA